jgi:hypothetical protein
LNAQQYLKRAELLLAHRHHRHGASPRTPEPAGVSPQLCTGVLSLYCAYKRMSRNGMLWEMSHTPVTAENTSRAISRDRPYARIEQAGLLWRSTATGWWSYFENTATIVPHGTPRFATFPRVTAGRCGRPEPITAPTVGTASICHWHSKSMRDRIWFLKLFNRAK